MEKSQWVAVTGLGAILAIVLVFLWKRRSGND